MKDAPIAVIRSSPSVMYMLLGQSISHAGSCPTLGAVVIIAAVIIIIIIFIIYPLTVRVVGAPRWFCNSLLSLWYNSNTDEHNNNRYHRYNSEYPPVTCNSVSVLCMLLGKSIGYAGSCPTLGAVVISAVVIIPQR